MKVFLSWSGERSRLIASALRDWLPLVLNEVSPFVSSDIDAGIRWLAEIVTELENTDFGILCVTAENQRMPWLNFEAGALAKVVDTSRVIPLAIDLRPAEIQYPLGQFQSQSLTYEGMGKIVSSLNSALSKPLPSNVIEKVTTKWWPDLEERIKEINKELDLSDGVEKTTRSDRELLEDILNSVRSLARIAARQIWEAEELSLAQLARRTEAPDHQTVTEKPSRIADLLADLQRSVELARGGRSAGPFVREHRGATQKAARDQAPSEEGDESDD